MSSEWQTVEISSICEGIFDGPHATPNKTDRRPVFLGISALSGGRLDLSSTEHLSEEDFARWTKRVLPAEGDIVFSYETRLGEAAMIPGGLRCCLGRRMALMRIDQRKAVPEYVLYAYLSPIFQEVIRARTIHGSTVDRLPLTEFGSFPIPLPSIETQRSIAAALRAIDDRITLLRETNATLEAIAQALFKSWFVDFDPVRAKMEGRTPEGMDEATAALFPNGFEASDLGKVPNGWHIATVGSLAQVVDCLHSKKPDLVEFGMPYLQLNCIREDGLLDTSKVANVSEADYRRWTSRIEVTRGDCVVTNVGRVGAVAQVPEGFFAAMGRNMTAVRLKAEYPYPTYLIELFQSPGMRREIDQKTDVGTILNALNVKSIPLLRCMVAPHKVMYAFEEIARPLRSAMELNLRRIEILATSRDTLLPRLISGQLRLPEAAALAEEATQ